MINQRLIHLIDPQFITEAQAGFRRGYSTIDQLVYLENYLQEGYKNRHHTVGVFFDIEKAFDMTWRGGILLQLEKWGFKGSLPKVISSFLSNRTFRVKINGSLSQAYVLENGIPQGSTLSCTLFNIAINSLVNNIGTDVKCCLYVDDLCIFGSGKTIGQISRKMQPIVNQVLENAEETGFTFSITKTKCVHFCRLRTAHYDPLLFINQTPIPCVDYVRFLGVTLDSKLTWEKHISDLILKCDRALNLVKCLCSTKWGANVATLIKIYKSLVLSKIDYGCFVYGSARSSRLLQLNKIQNRALRLCLGAFPTSPSTSLHIEANVMPLQYRREKLLNNYVCNRASHDSHRNYKILFKNVTAYTDRPTITCPLSVRAQEIHPDLLTEICNIIPHNKPEIPPWRNFPINVDTSLLQYDKYGTNPKLILAHFNNIISGMRHHNIIYTDGSKTEDGVGCAIVVQGEHYNWRLPDLNCDNDMITQWYHSSIVYLENQGKHITLLWVRSLEHTGW
uniref:Reverse transcriptase domain-containing protein n=1 Tax=Photinus pyralis TaxID=7054 RepID=A0A1Y1KRE1_PHOPY